MNRQAKDKNLSCFQVELKDFGRENSYDDPKIG